jgi:hypothetical protein
MELWSPPHDTPHLFEWWRPLLLASQQARRRRVPWPIHLDEFRLAGRVLRGDRPDVWIYEHHANGGSVCVDAMGTTYRFIRTPTAKGVGQFRPCDVRSAVWRAGLPDVVEPVRYREPVAPEAEPWAPGAASHRGDVELRKASGDAGASGGAGASGRVTRGGHLTVIDGGG